MQLVIVLLIMVSILSILSGFFILIGAEKSSRPFAVAFSIFSITYVLWTASIINPELWMANINISVVFFAATLLVTIWAFVNMQHDKVTRMHKGWRLLAISLLVLADIAALLFYFAALNGANLSWIAPLVVAPIFVIIFYAILRYRILQVSARVCRIWAYALLSVLCVIVYMSLFYLIAQTLFHVAISDEIVAINLLMVIILTAIFPIWSELNTALNSLLSTSKINLNYIVKSLNRFATQNVSEAKLADFLASHLHFRYIGIVIGDKIYATRKIDFSDNDKILLSELETDGKTIWQKPAGYAKELLDREKIVAVAELRDAKGRPFGQILIGQPMGKTTFDKRDLSGIEMIINLVASIIDSKERLES